MKVLACFLWIVAVKLLRLILDASLFPLFVLPMLVYYLYRFHCTGKTLRLSLNDWRPTTFLAQTCGPVLQQNWQEAEQMAGRWETTSDKSEQTLLRGSREKQGVL